MSSISGPDANIMQSSTNGVKETPSSGGESFEMSKLNNCGERTSPCGTPCLIFLLFLFLLFSNSSSEQSWQSCESLPQCASESGKLQEPAEIFLSQKHSLMAFRDIEEPSEIYIQMQLLRP